MTNTGQPAHGPAPAPRRSHPTAQGRGLDGFTVFLLGVCAHLAGTALVVLAVMGLMQLFDLLAARLHDPALAGILVGLAAVLLIFVTGAASLAAVRHHRKLSGRLLSAIDRRDGLRRAAIWFGFTCAVGLRAALLLAAATLPVTAVAYSAPSDAGTGFSQAAVYLLLALSYLILVPLVAVRVRRGLARLSARREQALRTRGARS